MSGRYKEDDCFTFRLYETMKRFLMNSIVAATVSVCAVTVEAHSYDPVLEVPYLHKKFCDLEVGGVHYAINKSDPLTLTVTTRALTQQEYSELVNNMFFKNIFPDDYKGEITVPETVTHEGRTYDVVAVGVNAFSNNKNLTKVNLPESIVEINEKAFQGCDNLKEVNIPINLEWIGTCAFSGCISLEALELHDNITGIGPNAFINCPKMKPPRIPRFLGILNCNVFGDFEYDEVYLSETLTIVHEYGLPNATKIIFGQNIPDETSDNGYPWLRSCSLFHGFMEPQEYVPRLKEMILPKSKFQASDGFIEDCPTLERIVLPETDSILVECGVFNCPGLKEFVSVNPQPPVCTAPLDFSSLSPQEQKKFFWLKEQADGRKHGTLTVPAGSEEAYRNAPVWKLFKEIRGVENIEDYLTSEITEISADTECGTKIQAAAGGVSVTTNEPLTAEVYSVTGVLVLRRRVNGTAMLQLAPGLYIVRAGSTTAKVRV